MIKQINRLLSVLFFIITTSINSQELPQVIPPSPSVASLMHFEEVPVDYYSGQPNIQFPIFNKSLGNLNIPIVLRYNTMGLRVNERSGWVGRGWSLDGEIVISRTVRGIRDEAMLTDNNSNPLNPQNQVGVLHNGFFDLNLNQQGLGLQDHVLQNFLWNASGKGSDKYGGNGNTQKLNPNISTRNGAFDKEPDLYQLSLLGQSARFFIVRVGNTLEVRMLSNESNIKVVPSYDTTTFAISYFTVTDTNGLSYILNVTEDTTNRSVTGIVPQYGKNATLTNETISNFKSAWKVSQIFSENGELLATYNYTLTPESYKLSSSLSEATIRSNFNFDFFFGERFGQIGIGNHNQFHESNRAAAVPEKTYTYNYAQINTQKISSILFRDNSSVEFVLSNQSHPEYEDGAFSILDEVKIFNLEGNLHKRFDFVYDNIIPNKALFLDKIDEFYAQNKKLTYRFDYNDKSLFPVALHSGFDNLENQDIWGYYRRVDNTFGPSIYKLPKQSADKDVVTRGVLKSISYPTGGKKVFDFESNTISHRGARPFTDAEFKALNPDNWNLGTNLSNARVIFNNTNQGTPGNDTSEVFTIDEQQTLEFIPTIYQLSENPNQGNGGFNDNDNSDTQQTPEDYLRNIDINLQQLQANGTYVNVDAFSFLRRRTVSLLPGTYRIKYTNLSLTTPSSDPYVNVRGVLYYKTYKETIDRLIHGGGLRIKSIKFLDKDNSVKNEMRYNYNENATINGLSLDTGLISSGTIDGILSNYKEYIMPKSHIFQQFTGTGGNAMHYSAYPTGVSYLMKDYLTGTHTSLTKGNYVGYRKVSMSQISTDLSKKKNGTTEFIYTTPADHPTEDITYGWPFIPNEDQSHRQGLLMSQRVFDASGLILADTKNTYYDPIEEPVGQFLHIADDPSCHWSHVYNFYDSYLDKTMDNPAFFETLNPADNCVLVLSDSPEVFYNVPVWKWARDLNFTKVLLKNTKTKSYTYAEDGTQHIIKSEDEFVYEPLNWQIKEKVSTTWENGAPVNLKTKYYYPVGANATDNTSTMLSSLRNNNRINEVIGMQTFRNGIKLSETQTIFDNYNNGLLLPSYVKVGKGNDTPQKRIQFYAYDNYGNPLEVSKADDTHISYIWGYNQSMPVAKAINATNAQITNVLNTTLNTGLTDVHRNNLKTALPNAQWSFYEYNPLAGITKTYDVRDYKTTYEYDNYYRLQQVKDNDGYLLSTNTYVYGSDNYVKTIGYQTETTDGTANANNPQIQLTNDDKIESITYFDGLGRAIQTINKQAGGNKQDIITPIVYDALGRQAKEFLPFSNPNQVAGTANLEFRNQNTLLSDLETYYLGKYPEDKLSNSSINAYSYKVFENSPLNRVLEQAAPGKDWHYDPSKVTYQTITTDIEQAIDDVSIGLRNAMFKETNTQQTLNYDADYAIYPNIGTLNITSNQLTLNLNLGAYTNLGNNRKLGNITYVNSGLHKLNNIVLADITSTYSASPNDVVNYKYYIEINNGYLQINKSATTKTVDATSSGPANNRAFSYTIPNTRQIQYEKAVSTNHTIKFNYASNNANEVKLFDVKHTNNNTENTELIYIGYYAEGELSKTITKDENWTLSSGKNHTTEEFKNTQGQVVLKRTYDNNEQHDTYYIYDDFGNLTYVLPPTASDAIIVQQSNNQSVSKFIPWQELVATSRVMAKSNNKKYVAYNDKAIRNADINSEFAVQGGFTIYTSIDGQTLYLDVNFSVQEPIELKQGLILNLKDFGAFKDTELGEIKVNDSKYVFYIRENALYIEGNGKIRGISQTLSSNTKLNYSQQYLWVRYMEVNQKFASQHEKEVLSYAKKTNQNPLQVYLNNEYDGRGGVNIVIDNLDNITLSFNNSGRQALALRQGSKMPLHIKRRIKNRTLGSISGQDYDYHFYLKDNAIVIEGSGKVANLNEVLYSSALPPQTSSVIASETIEGLGYIYHYDYRNRLVEKKIPGKDWEYIVYDKLDRPILTQDAKQRLSNTWLFTKYDIFGRIAYTGEYTQSVASRLSIQNTANNQTQLYEALLAKAQSIDNTSLYYSNNTFPNTASNSKLFTINYYDNYQSLDISESAFTKQQNDIVLGQSISMATTTLPTISKVRVLDTNNWITSATYYDDKAQPIYAASKNEYLNTIDLVASKLDFTGKLIDAETEHRKGTNNPIVIKDSFSYDHTSRLLTQLQSINGSEQELIVNNTYDELGQLVSKNVGGKTMHGLQTVDYNYNIRGWLKAINNGTIANTDLFGFKINYNTPKHAGVTPLYNGNISETSWQTANDNKTRSYHYNYDALNRIKAANYQGNYQLIDAPSETENYSLSNITYDKNGNIKSLNRMGLVASTNQIDIIDKLNYNYDPLSNKLNAVIDTATEDGFKDGNINGNDYIYDINGNMISDANKNIVDITYNHLNLPIQITINSDNGNEFDDGTISYVYDATGVKLSKKVQRGNSVQLHATTRTEYSGNFVYQDGSHSPLTLKFFSTPEGYVEPQYNTAYAITGYNYVYQYKDHLGNIRLAYSDTDNDGQVSTNEIIEENNYYPFGLKHKGYNNVVNGRDHNYGYNGIEETDELGLNVLEMDMRQYDPAIARWTSIDPVIHHNFSPYQAFDNNPVFWADPSGANSIYNWDTGQYVINGQQVSFDQAMTYANNGGNADGSNNNTANKNQSKPPKYLLYNIVPFGNMSVNKLDKKNSDYRGKFQLLTGYGVDPQTIHASKFDLLKEALSNLDESIQIKILKKLGLGTKIAQKLVKNSGILGLDPFSINEGFLEALPGIGMLLGELSAKKEIEDRMLNNESKWDNVFGGYWNMINQPDMTNVILIYTNENLFKKTNINSKDTQITKTKQAENDNDFHAQYKYIYYGTQSGSDITIFGRYKQ